MSKPERAEVDDRAQDRELALLAQVRMLCLMLYRLADIERITGSKPRACQVWAETQVILAQKETERAGTGVHRIFLRDEVIIACVVAAFHRQKFPVGQLQAVGKNVRDMLAMEEKGFRSLFEQAIAGHGQSYLIMNKLEIEGEGFGSIASTSQSPFVDLFKVLPRDVDKDDPITHIVDLNRALKGMRSK